MDLIGSQLGSYRVTDVLGRGGMGEVYVAEHQLIGRRAAIKVLRADLSRDQDTVQRFFNEARAATMIRHPGIVEIYDFGHASDGSAYLVMELLEGESLATRLKREGALRVPPAMSIARQIASAIAAAHDKGIVHRDLKPDNVFLVANADAAFGTTVKILDFGIAKLHGDARGDAVTATQTGALLGTPLYMSPEQCRGLGDIDHRADLYALGCILFHMLAGRPPFLGAGVGDVIGMHIHVEAPLLRTLAPRAPAQLEAILASLLAKDRARRPASMAQVARSLEQLLATPQLRDEVAAPGASAPELALDATIDPAAVALAATAAETDLAPAAAPTRPDATPVAPITTIRAAAGEQVIARPPSRRNLLIGLGGLAAAGAAGGLYLALRKGDGGAAAPSPTQIVQVEFDWASPLVGATLRPDGGTSAFSAISVERRLEVPGELAVLVLVQGTERFLGNMSYEKDEGDQMVGIGEDVSTAIDALTKGLAGAQLTIASYGMVVQPISQLHIESYRDHFAIDLARVLGSAADQLGKTGARKKRLIAIADGRDFYGPIDDIVAHLGTSQIETDFWCWGDLDMVPIHARAKPIASGKQLVDRVAQHLSDVRQRWTARFEIDRSAAARSSWVLSATGTDGLESEVDSIEISPGESHYEANPTGVTWK